MSNFPHINRTKPLMVVVDTSVFIHKLYQNITYAHTDAEYADAVKANIVYLQSGAWLGDLRPLLSSMVFVTDSKPYWRKDWLNDLRNTVDIIKPCRARSIAGKAKNRAKQEELAASIKEAMEATASGTATYEQAELYAAAKVSHTIAYKGGRKLPDYAFTKLKKMVLKDLNLNARVLGVPTYEADDMAASLVQTNTRLGNPYSILLLTVDSDWLGMINPSVTWVCMTGYLPVVRDTLDVVNSWAERRLGCRLESWREIWDIKGRDGDASDNLPPSEGRLLPVIDLLSPPLEHQYWLRNPERLEALFTDQKAVYTNAQARHAENHLRLLGLKPVINMLDMDK